MLKVTDRPGQGVRITNRAWIWDGGSVGAPQASALGPRVSSLGPATDRSPPVLGSVVGSDLRSLATQSPSAGGLWEMQMMSSTEPIRILGCGAQEAV